MLLRDGPSRHMYALVFAQVLVLAGAACNAWRPPPTGPPLCLPCAVPQVDNCMLDISGCSYLPSGAICKVQCKAPYQGNATIARCASNNTLEGLPLEWTPPNCSFSECPYPTVLPEGYVRDAAGDVYCERGYEGTPWRRCTLEGPQCTLQTTMEGCLPRQPCRLQEDQDCPRMDYQSCAQLSPGQSCRVRCLEPFAGFGMEVHCPADNTELDREPLRWSSPDCTLQCPLPEPLPYGYTNDSNGEWSCSEGWAGTAVHFCEYDGAPFCQRRSELRGCYRLMPCADLQLPPDVDECLYNITECQGGLPPGGACRLGCWPPFVDFGLPRVARCPAENLNPFQEPSYWQLPCCQLSCADPVPLPLGYRKEISRGIYSCDEGYVGDVNRSCLRLPNCSYEVRFEGCQRKVPCLPLEVEEENRCRMNISGCSAVEPGDSCQILCRPPFHGAGAAHCPEHNVDPARPLEVELPSCSASCDDLPPGYMRTAEGWRCADGYGGAAVAARVDCGAPLLLSGCRELQACRIPEADPCVWDLSDCVHVPPGGSCQVRCSEGVYEPKVVDATCPEGNTDPDQPILFDLLCTPRCDEPDPLPDSIVKDEKGTWACAEGFVGNASEECIISGDAQGNCSGFLNLTGCLPLTACAPLDLQDNSYNTQACASGTEPGDACRVACRAGLHGEATEAQCPEDNVDPYAPPRVRVLPDCRLECDSAPMGYEKTQQGWRCSPGYAGNAVASCKASTRCGAELHLEGCWPIVPCLRPTFGEDLCRFVAVCPEQLPPGGSCEIHCRAPYEGVPTVAQCSPENTLPRGEASWERPMCSFHVCPDPDVYSSNYTKDPGSPVGWRCSDSMTGIAQKRCESAPVARDGSDAPPRCEVQAGFLSGCGRPQPCVPMEESEDWDECRFDISHCGEMVPNSFCEVMCRAPYVGRSTYARCATFNMDPTTPVEWTPPSCQMDCPAPEPVPPGYVLLGPSDEWTQGLWTCAPGYIGSAQTRCQLGNGTCEAVQVLSGCLRLEPCVRPEVHCSLNFSECPEPLPPGEDCMVSCKLSYNGFQRPEFEDEEDDMEYNMSNMSNVSNFSNGSAGRWTNGNWSNLSDPTWLDPLIPTQHVIAHCPHDNTVAGRPMLLPELLCFFEDCIDPWPIPEGYTKEEDWACAAGFAGNATNECRFREDCVGETFLSECIPVSHCALPFLDPCTVEHRCGETLQPGETCELRCPTPTQGTPGFAYCPQLNTEPGAWAEIQLPQCESPCIYLENVQAPSNFLSCVDFPGACTAAENLTGWACASGFGGNNSISCHIDRERECNASYVFEGCKPLTKCAGLENIDPCQYIHSCIPGLLPGDACEVRCRPPDFVGDQTVGLCSWENTDPLKPPAIAWPTCLPQCTEPRDAPPAGYSYNATLDEWSCADGYLGEAVSHCGPNFQCALSFTLSGCVQKVPCQRPVIPAGCFYASTCSNEILPGTSCEIQCKSPYFGNATTASCDDENTLVNADTDYELPNCSLQCPDIPVDLTEAYVRAADGTWECNSSGYLGRPVTTCSEVDCVGILSISGCLPIVPCLSPDPRSLDICQFSFSGCDTLTPGTSCNVSCEAPYIGGGTTATCPDMNTDPMATIQFEKPNCTLLCPEPDPVPAGYVRGTDRWLCATGYVGTASASCLVDRFFSNSQGVCVTRTELTGCVPLQPCVLQPSAGCEFDTSNCSSVPAGGSCEVRCRVPFSGIPSLGHCPAENVDPQTTVLVEMPTCILDCPVPDVLPEGYNISFGAAREEGFANSILGQDPISGRSARVERRGYFDCEESWAGNLTVTCAVDPDCDWKIEFAGCRPTVPCAPLDLTLPPCGLVAPNCAEVASGRSCTATCAQPCTGESAELWCPTGNTDPLQPLMGKMPNCLTECDFVPAGYRRNTAKESGWECGLGYTGEAEVYCLPSGPGRVCETEILLQGCTEMVPCGPGNFDPCHYDLSDCLSVPRGSSCTIHCAAPFSGPSFNATCPSRNTRVNDGLVWEADSCRIAECPDPNITNETSVEFDAHGRVQCRSGFAGVPQRQCAGVGRECRAEAIFLGCEPIVSCGSPILDFCRHEEACQSTLPGADCVVPCKYPFYGVGMLASCPENNTDEVQQPFLGSDFCELGCEDPLQPPPGYSKANGSWACADGWAGTVHLQCVLNDTEIVNETCGSFLNFSGCLPLQPCVRPASLDVCVYQLDHELLPGAMVPVRCHYPPFNPEDVVEEGLLCPGDNVQVGREAQILALPSCEVFCPSPPPPPGYVKLHDLLSFGENDTGVEINRDPAYTCAEGWTGTANHSCSINRSDHCAVPVTISGCFQLVPCKPIDPRSFDVCTYNISECQERSQDTIGPYTGPLPNTTCELTCREPTIGGATTAMCQDLNINPNRLMEYDLPTCEMYCPKPDVIPTGYEHLGTTVQEDASLEYRCAEGYGGTPSVSCYLRGAYSSVTQSVACSTIVDFEGCRPLQSCRAPEVDSCRHDVQQCQSLQPGQRCEVTCTYPLEGAPATFECPADNVVPQRVLVGTLPACRFPFDCEEPIPLPDGYVKVNETSFECAEGYIGEAQWDCFLARLCSPILVLSGCDRLVPCALPALEDQLCGLNYTACANVWGGQNCKVPCLPGFLDNSSEMSESEVLEGNLSDGFACPVDNKDPTQVIHFQAPECIFQGCVDPSPLPAGYVKMNGTWSCDAGFVGEVEEECDTCNASLTLSGCFPLLPCVAPRIDESCVLDLSNCSSLAPGETCTVECQAPFQGEPTYGTCPADNTDPQLEFNVTRPDCRLVCPWPETVPLGYTWTEGAWACSNGYHGLAVFECHLEDDCTARPELKGCNAPQPCAAPLLDRCQHIDASECSSLEPTEACNLTCLEPFLGERTIAVCPYDNPSASKGPDFLAPRCVKPSCPEVVPPGYQKTAERGWSCARGYAGEAHQSCVSDHDCCELHLHLEGCRPIVGCQLPVVDECELDLTECRDIWAGEECTIRCRPPFVGMATTGSCRGENTDPLEMLNWTAPRCQIPFCARPMPPPMGYIYSGLQELCAPGFAGSPRATCRGGHPNTGCQAPPMELTGCAPIISCPLPELDTCMYQTACVNQSVDSDGFCEVMCSPPFAGPSTNATCPRDNVEQRNATLQLPTCVLQCTAPEPLPKGYAAAPEGGWRCAEGFIGVAVGRCLLDQATCTSSLELSGCLELQPCLAPAPTNPCMYDVSDCRNVQPGSFCRLLCKPPYAGGSPKLICPAGNTDPRYVMKWAEPYCFCTNPEHTEVPLGFAEDGEGGYTCAPGFVGHPRKRCQAARFECLQKSELAGCVSPDVCHVMPFVDENDSPGLITGKVSFGPAMVAGVIQEEQVEGYEIFFADDCHEAVGSSVASVPRGFLPANGGCCEVMHYVVQLTDVWIPEGATELLVTIRGLTTGQVVELIDSTGGIDIPRPSTTNAGNKTPVTGTAPRAAVLGLCSWVLLLMW